MFEINLGHYLSLGAIIFTIGVAGIFLNRKNIIVILMSIELILLAVNINLVSFSIFLNDLMEFKDQINDKILEDARKSNCLKETELGIEISNYLHDLSVLNKKQVEEAIEITLLCYKMPEFMPRKKLNLLSSLKKSYGFNYQTFSLKDFLAYVKLKFGQVVVFLKSYFFKFSLHNKRRRFFKDFNNFGL